MDQHKEQQMKDCTHEKRRAVPHKLKKVDTVLLKRQSPLSYEAAYEPRTYRVTRIQATAVTAQHENKRVIRNASFFKHVPKHDGPTGDSEDW